MTPRKRLPRPPVQVGDVVQLDLDHALPACFVVVTQVEEYGVWGYAPPAYCAVYARWEHVYRIGPAALVLAEAAR